MVIGRVGGWMEWNGAAKGRVVSGMGIVQGWARVQELTTVQF